MPPGVGVRVRRKNVSLVNLIDPQTPYSGKLEYGIEEAPSEGG